VEPDHSNLLRLEEASDTLRLREALGNATWTEHLESMKRNHPSPQIGEAKRTIAVEPVADLPFRRRLPVSHFRVPG
jgi:hypothetical protein